MIKRGKELGYVEYDDAGVTLFEPPCVNDVHEIEACIYG